MADDASRTVTMALTLDAQSATGRGPMPGAADTHYRHCFKNSASTGLYETDQARLARVCDDLETYRPTGRNRD